VTFFYAGDLFPAVHAHKLRFDSVQITLRGHDVDLRGANLYFWVQARPSDKAVDLVLVGQPVDAAVLTDVWSTVTLRVAPDAGWECMNTMPLLSDRYACAPAADVLRDINRRFGLIIYPIACGVPCKQPEQNPTGTIDIDDVTINYRLIPR
jgi:hypothetical protein